MSTLQLQLLDLLKERSFKRGTFKLASGAVSDYYIDGRTTTICSAGAALIGANIYERTKDLNLDAIGGMAVGAVPLTTAAVISYHQHGKSMEGFWVREAKKDHGMQKLIEGNVKPGARVAIVDDVFTSGGSALKAAAAAKDQGCEVVLVLAIVDRLQGARDAFAKAGIANYQSIFTIRDFGVNA